MQCSDLCHGGSTQNLPTGYIAYCVVGFIGQALRYWQLMTAGHSIHVIQLNHWRSRDFEIQHCQIPYSFYVMSRKRDQKGITDNYLTAS